MAALAIQLDRARKTPLAAQIYRAIREGIENGRPTYAVLWLCVTWTPLFWYVSLLAAEALRSR